MLASDPGHPTQVAEERRAPSLLVWESTPDTGLKTAQSGGLNSYPPIALTAPSADRILYGSPSSLIQRDSRFRVGFGPAHNSPASENVPV